MLTVRGVKISIPCMIANTFFLSGKFHLKYLKS